LLREEFKRGALHDLLLTGYVLCDGDIGADVLPVWRKLQANATTYYTYYPEGVVTKVTKTKIAFLLGSLYDFLWEIMCL
jgi:hypothetical protein